LALADVLLISSDQQLADLVATAVGSVSECVLSHGTATGLAGGSEPIDRHFSLVIVHHTACVTKACVNRILEIASRPQNSRMSVVIISDSESAADVEMWIDAGAADILWRPLDLGRLSFLVDSLTLRVREGWPCAADDSWLTVEGQPPFCCESEGMRGLLDQVKRLANRDCNILIGGETGTGKTHLAGVIHGLSSRASDPFLAVNCAAIPADLVESELFGHRRGAFTSANQDQQGKLQVVGSGSLLLDEIDTLPWGTQAKLLHVVEGRSYVPVGGSQSLTFQGRFLAASNQSLEQLVSQNRFRADLFFRLNVLELEIPPLRERRSDVRLLAERYLTESARRFGRSVQYLTNAAIEKLEQHSWPGNVRELYNVLERLMAYFDQPEIGLTELCRVWGGRLRSAHWGGAADEVHVDAACVTVTASPALPREATLSNVSRDAAERARLVDLLRQYGQNRTSVARALGISRTALYKKLEKHGLVRRVLPESS
jgi:DNA-binding NtrC family response regulator